MRHGESEYNVLKKCAGWLDCNLTANGIAQARAAGRLLAEQGFLFDVAFSSELTRAKHTRELILDEMGLTGIPLRQSWRLNERHYGGLDDLTTEEAQCRFGQETVRLCREDFAFRPPSSSSGVSVECLPPATPPDPESMRDATARCAWYWHGVVVPAVERGARALVVAHGDILRLLCGQLFEMTEDAIVHSPVAPNAAPFILEFNDDFGVAEHYYLSQIDDTVPVLVTAPLVRLPRHAGRDF